MAFNKEYSENIEEGFQSKFNEAFLKMHRIHRLQDMMNMCRINPLKVNEQLDIYNFQGIISGCDGILMEVYGKLTDEERKEVTELKETIEEFQLKNPVFQLLKNNVNGKSKTDFDLSTWNILKKAIFKYECKVRELLSRTGYDSPNKDEWDMESL